MNTVLKSYHFPSIAWKAIEIIKEEVHGDGGENCPARQRHTVVLVGSEENSKEEERMFVFGDMDTGKERYYEGLWVLRRCIGSNDEDSE